MKLWVGVTDNQWFNFLSEKRPDEVNFWQPSATPPFTNAPTGMPFLFKLKRPYNHIAGGGYFVTYSRLPLSLAWEVFGEKNGCSSLEDLRRIIAPLVSREFKDGDIGCTVLANPFFLEQQQWIDDIPGWSSNIVRGKMYETGDVLGRVLWKNVQLSQVEQPMLQAAEQREKYGEAIAVRPRLGQSSFRVLVTDAYQRRCAITGESTLVALEAAHIVPYSDAGDHDVRNGLLLRADFHRLFDVGLVGVTPELKVKVSPRIRETWFNGKAYYRLDNQPLSVIPSQQSMQPDPDRLNWHLKNCFQA